MNILVLAESHSFDRQLAREAGRLAANTWANITLLAALPRSETKSADDCQQNLVKYRQIILESFPADSSCPYDRSTINVWRETDDGSFVASSNAAKKRLGLILTKGDITKEIITLSSIQAIDLVMFGGDMTCDSLLVTAATEAARSVLVVKSADAPEQIVCCLDHEHVTHNSLEMINQLVTLYDADLKIVGFSSYGDQERLLVEEKLKQLLDYYNNVKLTPWLEVVDGSVMTPFILQESKKNMVAVWVEKSSSFTRLFPLEKVASLICDSPSSVLLLR